MKLKTITIGNKKFALKTYSKFITEMGLQAIERANHIIIRAKEFEAKFEPSLAFCAFDQTFEAINVQQKGNLIQFTYHDFDLKLQKWVENVLSIWVNEIFATIKRIFAPIAPIYRAVKSFVQPITFADLLKSKLR